MKEYYGLIPSKTKEEVKETWVNYLRKEDTFRCALDKFCKEFNLYYSDDIVDTLFNNKDCNRENLYAYYLQCISSLKQYKDLTYDTVCIKENNIAKQFDLIETLKIEQELLVEKVSKVREKGDAGTYKNLITALRDISRLIHDEEHMKNAISGNDATEVVEYLIEIGTKANVDGNKKLDGRTIELINKLGYKVNVRNEGIYYYK